MSINALTNVALSRRDDFRPAGRPPNTYGEVASAAGTPPTPIAGATQAATAARRLLHRAAPESAPAIAEADLRQIRNLIQQGVAPVGSDESAREDSPTLLTDVAKAMSSAAPLPAGGTAGTPLATSVGAPAGDQLPKSDTTNTGLRVLTTYIPTEVLALYVTFMTVVGPAMTTADGRHAGHWGVFYGFLVATPLLVWVTFATKLVGAGKPLPLSPRYWPMWEMIAATTAFTAWALGLPQSPFARLSWFSKEMAGLMVTVVSAGLGLLAPIFVRNPLPAAPAGQPGASPGNPTSSPGTPANPPNIPTRSPGAPLNTTTEPPNSGGRNQP